ncbi:MAG: outer membrane beta-barrel protein [Thermoanaerobaculia bacterium]|nr:outer membrane beta-barrel protein [Thermoanaerobaculia bacterium]
MPTQRRLRFMLRLAVVALLLSSAGPGTGWAEDWEARLLGSWVTTSADVLTELDDGPGLYVGVERRLNERWGVELGLGWHQLEGSVTERVEFFGLRFESRIGSEVEWLPVSIAGNFHLTPRSDFDVYVSARAGQAFFQDVRITSEASFATDLNGFPLPVLITDPGPAVTLEFAADDSLFYGARLGVDRSFGDGAWAFSATIDWTVLELEYDPLSALPPPFVDPVPDVQVDLDPVTIGIGVSRRW